MRKAIFALAASALSITGASAQEAPASPATYIHAGRLLNQPGRIGMHVHLLGIGGDDLLEGAGFVIKHGRW